MILDLAKPARWLPPPKKTSASFSSDSITESLRGSASLRRDDDYTPTPTAFDLTLAKRKARRHKHSQDFARQLASYRPQEDPKITGSPACTLFLGRLPYSATSADLQNELEKYGKIRASHVKHGYGFVLFESTEAVKAAITQTTGTLPLAGHKVLLDWERARRQQPSWKPRRLGGGLGGRFSVNRRRKEFARSHQITQRGAASIEPRQSHRSGQYNGGDIRRVRHNDERITGNQQYNSRGSERGDGGGRTLRQY